MLENFNLRDTQHVKLRFFKPTYHLTMGMFQGDFDNSNYTRPSDGDNL